MEEGEEFEIWTMKVDNSSYKQHNGVGLVLTSLDAVKMENELRFKFNATKNARATG